jgi:simple sugar transport system permease protein
MFAMPDLSAMPELSIVLAIIVATLRAATPLMLAGLGELVTERAGVLNLGVEGMMLIGAAVGFVGVAATGSVVLGLLAAVVAGALASLLFGVLTLSLMANQVATGLALTIFGVGFSALIGNVWIGTPIVGLATLIWPGLSQASPMLQQLMLLDPLVWLAIISPFLVSRFLSRTRAGLVLRAVGESHDVAHALGYSVIRIRYLAVMFGGAMSGLAGAYLSLAYTPMWAENMVAGRGWIAVSLVVFSTWKPLWLAAGACLFGLVTIAQFQAQAWGIDVSSNLLAMLPYLATIVVLVLISRDTVRLKLNAPASLGRPFHATA